jgi:DNA-binding winged helix-turn-helix (wHTH) protein/TolB-like protein
MHRVTEGEWWAEPKANEIGRGGETVRHEPKAMEDLMVLVGRAGQAVTREELLAAVWPGVVVGDEVLTQCIIKLRRALGDDPRSPRYIETISKRGYRLIVASGRPRDGTGAPPAPMSPRTWSIGLLAGITLAVAGAGAYLYWRAAAPPPGVPDADAMPAETGVPRDVVTVTVLPFESLGEDPGQVRLAAGIGSYLMTDLSRLSGLRLIAPSVAAARGGTPGTGRFVVSGSVQREMATLRVNVRLTDSRTKEQLWSHRYEGTAGECRFDFMHGNCLR